jgi:Uma2 family endonuclease
MSIAELPAEVAVPEIAEDIGTPAIVLKLAPLLKLDEQLFQKICQQNPELVFELSAQGELIVMTPTGMAGGSSESEIIYSLKSWWRTHRRGQVYSSSTGITLSNGAIRSPDACWISQDRLDQLTPDELQGFGKVSPNFVIELRSPSNTLHDLKMKLVEYLVTGTQLGWIIDPLQKQVHIYRPGQEPVILDQPTSVSGDPELPGFVLDLTEIWPS